MVTLEKRIQQWKQWVNRNKQFSTDELEEMENHLREEILYLTEHENIPDHKAFDQALDILGEKGLLDEEFGKIRRSKFDKVKLWAYGQTLVIITLVIVLAGLIFQINNKKYSDDIIDKRIAYISGWQRESNDYSFSNVVTNQYDTYFLGKGPSTNIYHFSSKDEDVSPLYEESHMEDSDFFSMKKKDVYFQKPIPPEKKEFSFFFDGPHFDIDTQNNLYCWNKITNQVDVYFNSTLKESISISPMPINFEIIDLRIINKTLILCTLPKTCPFPSQEKTLNQSSSDRSYLLYINLETKNKKVEKVVLQKNIISMDRSENEIVLLGEDGEILIYTLQANILVPHLTLKIKNFDTISFGSQLSLLFSNYKHQLVLKDNWSFNKYYFLSKIGNNKLEIVPITNDEVDGVIKIFYQKVERIVMISRQKIIYNRNEIDYLPSLYLFKD